MDFKYFEIKLNALLKIDSSSITPEITTGLPSKGSMIDRSWNRIFKLDLNHLQDSSVMNFKWNELLNLVPDFH